MPRQDGTGSLLSRLAGRCLLRCGSGTEPRHFRGYWRGGAGQAVLKFSPFLTDTTQTSLCTASPVAACPLVLFAGVLTFHPPRVGSAGLVLPRAHPWAPLLQPHTHPSCSPARSPPAALHVPVGTPAPQPRAHLWARLGCSLAH